jgi:hypothetical protein
MIRYQRSMQLKRGRHALRWAKELTDYMNTSLGGPALELFRSRFSNVSTLYWIADFKDLAALQTWQRKVGTDPGYRELTNRSLDIVVDGSINDTVLESV